MLAIFAEDESDASTLEVLIKRITGIPNEKTFKKGFRGCGRLRKDCCLFIDLYARKGADQFIICQDSDGIPAERVKSEIRSILKSHNCDRYDHEIIVPVQSIEAWMISDEEAIKKVIKCRSFPVVYEPELQDNPKKWLQNETKRQKPNLRYISAFNGQVAQHIDLVKLEAKCPSFKPLRDFVTRA